MVGITLTSEQVKAAPAEVRRWLEQQIAASFGFTRPVPPVEAPRHLVGCRPEALRAALGLFQHSLPVTSVFFELAREPAAVLPQGLRVLHVEDMTRHCRLQAPSQLIACLEAINHALQQCTGDAEAVLTVVDSNQHVLVPEVTAQGIHAIWQEIIAHRQTAQTAAAQTAAAQTASVPTGAAPPALSPGATPSAPSGPVPGQSFHPYAINVKAPGG